jgi:hypothetical protein
MRKTHLDNSSSTNNDGSSDNYHSNNSVYSGCDTNSNSNTKIVFCEDEYEAEKLMWILSRTGEGHSLKHATAVGEKELILLLDDDSSHSIMMFDEQSAMRLQEAVDMMLFDGKSPHSVHVHKNRVHMKLR